MSKLGQIALPKFPSVRHNLLQRPNVTVGKLTLTSPSIHLLPPPAGAGYPIPNPLSELCSILNSQIVFYIIVQAQLWKARRVRTRLTLS